MGKRIIGFELKNNTFTIKTEDGNIVLTDYPDCCANKYFVCDDDLSYYVELGAEYLGYEERSVQHKEWDGNEEINFLAILTSAGEFVLASHNEHNGYYGGMNIEES